VDSAEFPAATEDMRKARSGPKAPKGNGGSSRSEKRKRIQKKKKQKKEKNAQRETRRVLRGGFGEPSGKKKKREQGFSSVEFDKEGRGRRGMRGGGVPGFL